MTNAEDDSRLDRIERIVESNARAIEANSKQTTANTAALTLHNAWFERMEQLVESNARSAEASSNANADMRQAIVSLSQSVEALVRVATSTIERVERLEGQD